MSTRIGNRRWCSATASPWSKPDGDVHRIQSAIAELFKKKEVRILWVPGHCSLRGNELADLEAKLGSEVAQPSVPLDSSTCAALIRREERLSSLTHPRLTALYTTRLREEEALLQKSRPNRPHPIPLRTPSPPPTLATYDRNVGDGQLPTLRGGRRFA